MAYKKIQNNPEIRRNSIPKFIRWDAVFSEEELDYIVKYCDELEKNAGTVELVDGVLNEKVRKSKVGYIHKNEHTAWFFEKMNMAIEKVNDEFFNFDLNGYHAIQYSEYHGKDKGKYNFHMDSGFGENGQNHEMRKLSVVIMLNDPQKDFKGGKFHINMGSEKNSEIIEMVRGRMLFFPSFLIHKVAPVTSGVRKSLVFWVTGPKFT